MFIIYQIQIFASNHALVSNRSESQACESAYKDGETAYLKVNGFFACSFGPKIGQSFICFICLILMFFYSSLKYLDMFSLLTSRRGSCKSKFNSREVTAGQSFENHLFRLQQLHVKMEGELRAKRWINNQQTQIQQQKDFFLHLFRILAAGSSWLSLSSFSPNSPWQVLKKISVSRISDQ